MKADGSAPAGPAPDLENAAALARTTCGWAKPELDLDAVWRYWRDVHSPAISRRAGVWWYRHTPFGPVRPGLFDPLPGVEYDCPPGAQLRWLSDVVYRDEAGLQAFLRSPADPAVTALLLADIGLIVERSTTYKTVGDNMRTFADRTGDAVPIGPAQHPTFSVFFRRRSAEPEFRAALRAAAQRWSAAPGVLRLRLNLFEVPDMEAERRAGYPVRTHPAPQQYQAWLELVLAEESAARGLLAAAADLDLAGHLRALHAYPVPAVYTFVHGGRPTIIGLRGYPAHCAIEALGADHAADPALLEWMYGLAVRGGGTS